MNIDRRILPLVLGLFSTGVAPAPILAAISGESSHARPHGTTQLQSETTRLIRADAEKNRLASAPVPAEAHPPTPTPNPDGAVLLERLTVWSEKEIPNFDPPRETTVAKFLRTGTIARHVGTKVTTRFWSSGDAGLVLTFSR